MPENEQFQIVTYDKNGGNDPLQLRVDIENGVLWATQAQMAELFDVKQPNISTHLSNIFEEGELEERSNIKKINIASATKPVTIYSLDTVISVGYRVNSKSATRFRQWATTVLKAYVSQGYVINDRALRDNPEKLNKLAAEVRALRATEKSVYQKVRECFRVSASDYDPKSSQVRRFYSLLQDKFIHAVTRMTSASIILDRADYMDENMGIQSFTGKQPTTAEVTVGKNYLQSAELYRLHLLSEQFLLFAESTALAGKNMSMASLHAQLDRLLTLNDYPVLDGYREAFREQAEEHARRELAHYRIRMKVEATGLSFDPEAHALGEYSEILE